MSRRKTLGKKIISNQASLAKDEKYPQKCHFVEALMSWWSTYAATGTTAQGYFLALRPGGKVIKLFNSRVCALMWSLKRQPAHNRRTVGASPRLAHANVKTWSCHRFDPKCSWIVNLGVFVPVAYSRNHLHTTPTLECCCKRHRLTTMVVLC